MSDKTFLNFKPFDNTFNISDTALGVAALIGNVEISRISEEEKGFLNYSIITRSTPFYNGRERGICISILCFTYSRQLNIVFGEQRNSDNIFLDVWESHVTTNPPTVENFTDEAYDKRQYFGHNEHYNVAREVEKIIKSFYKELLEEYRTKLAKTDK